MNLRFFQIHLRFRLIFSQKSRYFAFICYLILVITIILKLFLKEIHCIEIFWHILCLNKLLLCFKAIFEQTCLHPWSYVPRFLTESFSNRVRAMIWYNCSSQRGHHSVKLWFFWNIYLTFLGKSWFFITIIRFILFHSGLWIKNCYFLYVHLLEV